MSVTNPVIIGISGASGSIMARETVNELLHRDIPTVVVCSNSARLVWQEELEQPFSSMLSEWREHPLFQDYGIGDVGAPIASGTFKTRGMAIVPSSMNTVASVAHGLSGNLLLRAADVSLKEGRKVVMVPRETPLHSIHLENLLTLSRAGVVILPPEPAFYLKPRGIDELVSFMVNRVLVALGISDDLPTELRYSGD